MIGTAVDGLEVSITGLGCHVPERVVTNDELARYVDTSDEWIREPCRRRGRRSGRPGSTGRTSTC
jgi:3-oxoacyl-[acyl-carrier-protein] synthase-3